MPVHRILGGGSLLALCLACGGSSFTVNGTIKGNSLKPGDAASSLGTIYWAFDSTPPNGAVLVLSNSSGLCASASAGKEPKSSQFMTFTVGDLTTNLAPTVGTYTIWQGTPTLTKLASAQYAQTDANCQQIQFAGAVSGMITVTSINNGDVSGNFDLTFDSGDHVTGSFSAKNCNALIPALSNSTCG